MILPSAFPFILNGLRVASNLAFMAVVSAGLIGARAGLGHLIMDSQTMLETDKMLVGILCLGILGGVLDRGADLVVRRGLARFTHGVSIHGTAPPSPRVIHGSLSPAEGERAG